MGGQASWEVECDLGMEYEIIYQNEHILLLLLLLSKQCQHLLVRDHKNKWSLPVFKKLMTTSMASSISGLVKS